MITCDFHCAHVCDIHVDMYVCLCVFVGAYIHLDFRCVLSLKRYSCVHMYVIFMLCVYVRMHTRTYVHACREKDMEREGERDRNSYMYVFIYVHAHMYTHISYTILIEPTTKTSILRT